MSFICTRHSSKWVTWIVTRSSHQPLEVSTVILSIVKVRKYRHRKVKWFTCCGMVELYNMAKGKVLKLCFQESWRYLRLFAGGWGGPWGQNCVVIMLKNCYLPCLLFLLPIRYTKNLSRCCMMCSIAAD